MVDILFTAFLLSVVLVGIHSFFGMEILKRGIIFTDLAIGQMAALGAAISLFFFEGEYLYPTSLLLAFLGAYVIAVASKVEKLSEAFIGLIYAFGIATVFLILSKSPHGTEDFQRLLANDLLFVSLQDIYSTTGIYFLIGICLYLTGKFFKNRLKDISFFLLFAVTVTSSVKLAGVLVVFSLLVAPALVSLMMVSRLNLIFAWIYGTLVNLLGVIISYKLDLPTGYTLVSLHSLLAAFVFLIKPSCPRGRHEG
ncbi:MAG: metal ABC transporter permease [Deltaproteobacteria bacterium]|nr:metal ABC transporter permease [Deltaproteobacteria bacterium]